MYLSLRTATKSRNKILINVPVKPEVMINTMYAIVDTHTLSLDKEIIFLQLLILNFP